MEKVVNVVIPPLVQAFTYGVSAENSELIKVGDRVEVPFGKRRTTGFVISEGMRTPSSGEVTFDIKLIDPKNNAEQCFRPEDLEFYKWVANYYGDSLADVIDVAVPHAVPKRFSKFISADIPQETASLKGSLQRQVLQCIYELKKPIEYRELLGKFPGASAVIKKLSELNLIKISEVEELSRAFPSNAVPEWTKTAVTLTAQQTEAAARVNKSIQTKRSDTFLLHGVTGSGKTEIYIEVIQSALEKDLGALVLAPEIALTPQLIDRFRARLGDRIVVLHSALSKRERWEAWRTLLEKKGMVAIGARSGVFAPVQNLGIIIVDEEHDQSYKQSEGLRYNARDVAVMRGKFQNTPVLLGTATPSLESFYNAVKKKYFYLLLNARHAEHEHLDINIVDLNRIKTREMASKNISPQLKMAIEETLSRDEQTFILYNRRGFASYLQCETCESVVTCPNCSVTLTYHQNRNTLLCHYCNLNQVPPQFCPNCLQLHSAKKREGNETIAAPGKLAHRGAGTERVYEELQILFPNVAIDRLDRDAVGDLESYRKILSNVRSGVTKILVGTQMIAKGHDLPGVTLVGIVDCDVGLHMPDFRASERIFQLLTQASGRAGRGDKKGKVILQTRVPRHASLVMTAKQDFRGFAQHELAIRNEMKYPPFTKLMRILASCDQKELAGAFLGKLKEHIVRINNEHKMNVKVLGPACAPLEKLKTHYRWHLLLKSDSASDLVRLSQALNQLCSKQKKIRIVFDMDPQDML